MFQKKSFFFYSFSGNSMKYYVHSNGVGPFGRWRFEKGNQVTEIWNTSCSQNLQRQLLALQVYLPVCLKLGFQVIGIQALVGNRDGYLVSEGDWRFQLNLILWVKFRRWIPLILWLKRLNGPWFPGPKHLSSLKKNVLVWSRDQVNCRIKIPCTKKKNK